MKKEGFPNQTLIRLPVEAIEKARKLPLAQSLYFTDIGHFPEALSHIVDRPEGDNSHIFIYCLGGSGWLEIDGQKTVIGETQGILIRQGVPHRYGSLSKKGWQLYWLHFNGSESNSFMDYITEECDYSIIYLPRPTEIVLAFESCIRRAQQSLTQQTLVGMGGSCAMLLSLINDIKRPTAKRLRQVEDRVLSTIELMKHCIRSPKPLDHFAKEACLSQPHYCALFKQLTGSAPMQLYTQIRIQRACELLSNTSMNVQSIAENVGFDDPFYFSRAFKKSMGISPKNYRESQRQNSNL